jgi:transposase InsO family protein
LPHLTRLIRSYRESGEIRVREGARRRFPAKYTEADLELLVEVDRAHQRLSGPATRRIIEREWQVFGKREYARLAEISPAHLYNLRHSVGYRQRAAEFTQTHPAPIAIGERRKPDPQGRPGYLRVDTVHQGDWEGEKGVYHINSVDAVSQWEVLGCAPRISEQHLLPVLEAMLHQFPFRILGFHADNGSEYVNRTVAKLLNKLLVDFTRSRPNRSSDNALVEGKNGAIIRKHMGYGHIAAEHAEHIQRFYMAHLNPYLNYHRPCGFAQVTLDERGRRRRRYRQQDYQTPYEKLRSLPQAHRYLKDGMRWELLDGFAYALSDTEAARRMMRAKAALLCRCKLESPFPPRFPC